MGSREQACIDRVIDSVVDDLDRLVQENKCLKEALIKTYKELIENEEPEAIDMFNIIHYLENTLQSNGVEIYFDDES
jgi:hypothetical protein